MPSGRLIWVGARAEAPDADTRVDLGGGKPTVIVAEPHFSTIESPASSASAIWIVQFTTWFDEAMRGEMPDVFKDFSF